MLNRRVSVMAESLFAQALVRVGLLLPCLVLAAPGGFRATAISVQANYALTVDAHDVQQLSDGVEIPFPMWLSKASVGWHNVTPVRISGTVNIRGLAHPAVAVRVARRDRAGVSPPSRIDVYCDADVGRFRHVGDYAAAAGALADERAHSVHVPIDAECRQVELVVHAQGTNIFIDEIGVVEQATTSGTAPAGAAVVAGDLERDSLARLRAGHWQGFLVKAQVAEVRVTDATPLRTWHCDPWSGQLGPPKGADFGRPPTRVSGSSVEHEVRCIGVMSTAGAAVRVTHDGDSALALASVSPIVAADGQVVFDPLTPLTDGLVPDERGLGFAYLWLDFDLAKLGAGEHRITLRFAGAGGAPVTEVPFDLAVYALDVERFPPYATVWAYSDAKPIWNRPGTAVADLAAHGVTVNVIPPHRIPQPQADGGWPLATAVKLTTDLRLFAEYSSLILLALGWHPGVKPAWLPASPAAWTPAQRRSVARWYERLQQVVASAGIPPERWALYPVDELYGDKATYFAELLDAFTEMQLEPRWYANPTQVRRGTMSDATLAAVAPRVAYWQPILEFAEKGGRHFFSSLQRPWWVYHNPPYPAKSAAPLEHYLLPAWRAWAIGAQGSGVWAYSDTQGSSAWDDLDGPRGDWAMVYEGDDSVVGSRRWAAFREGLEDLALLRHFAAARCMDRATRERIVTDLHDGRLDSTARDALRQGLFGLSCPSLSQ